MMINTTRNRPKPFRAFPKLSLLSFRFAVFILAVSPPLHIKNLKEGFAERTGDTFALVAQS
jgi:hypothetical protein